MFVLNTYTEEGIRLQKIIFKYVKELAVITKTYLFIHIRTLHTFKYMTNYIYVNKYLHTIYLDCVVHLQFSQKVSAMFVV